MKLIAQPASRSTKALTMSAAVVAASAFSGLGGAEPARAQAGYGATNPEFRQRMQRLRASERDYRELEANGFRYIGTDGHPPYVYYVYRRSDGIEYHCAQGAWKTGPCFPGNRRDPNDLPRHIRIPDLKNAGYEYQGVSYAGSRVEHVYRQRQTGIVYLCPNEGQASCRSGAPAPTGRRSAYQQ